MLLFLYPDRNVLVNFRSLMDCCKTIHCWRILG